MSHHRLIRQKDRVEHKTDPNLGVMDIHNFQHRNLNRHRGDQIGDRVHGIYQKDDHKHNQEPEKAPEPEKPSKWQEFKDSAKHTAKEYVKHKAIDATLEHGAKPLAKWAGQHASDWLGYQIMRML